MLNPFSSRRGMTLIELLLVIVVLAVVGSAVGRVMLTTFRVSRDQLVQANLQSNVRLGGLVLPLELREIGYDSNIVTGVVTSDIEAVGTSWIQFRAMRGVGYTCGTPTTTEFRIYAPTMGARLPRADDGFLLYVENDPNIGTDDQWVRLKVNSIDYNSDCNGNKAIRLETEVPDMGGGLGMVLSQFFLGGPIRYYERMRFGTMVDADGMTYLGARSISRGEDNYSAVAGPIDPGTGVAFHYYRRDGNEVSPGGANPAELRAVDLTLTGESGSVMNMAGSVPKTIREVTLQTRVALRNALDH